MMSSYKKNSTYVENKIFYKTYILDFLYVENKQNYAVL